MDDRSQFATWIFASQLGVLSADYVVARADQRIMELEAPESWLIDVSLDGKSSELAPLTNGSDDEVYKEVLQLVFQAWTANDISDSRFAECCSELWKRAGYQSRWYEDLVWIDDEFYLVEQGIFLRDDSVKKIRERLAKLLES